MNIFARALTPLVAEFLPAIFKTVIFFIGIIALIGVLFR